MSWETQSCAFTEEDLNKMRDRGTCTHDIGHQSQLCGNAPVYAEFSQIVQFDKNGAPAITDLPMWLSCKRHYEIYMQRDDAGKIFHPRVIGLGRDVIDAKFACNCSLQSLMIGGCKCGGY